MHELTIECDENELRWTFQNLLDPLTIDTNQSIADHRAVLLLEVDDEEDYPKPDFIQKKIFMPNLPLI